MNPIVPHDLLELALQSLDSLLEEHKATYDRHFSLATGDLGFVVAADLAARLTGSTRYGEEGATLLARVWEVGCRGRAVGLHTGQAGLAWTVGRHPHLASRSMERWCDEFLAHAVTTNPDGSGPIGHFDLVEGAAGLLVAAAACHANTEAIADMVLGWCDRDSDRLRVYTPASRTMQEANAIGVRVENWGVAHGLPGVLGALQISRHVAEVPRLARALQQAEQAARWALERFGAAGFPSYLIEGEPVPSKHAAWCYGALPVIFLLSHKQLGEELATHLQPWETEDHWRTNVAAHGQLELCHGFAGVGLVLALLAMSADSQTLWNNAMKALRAAMQPPPNASIPTGEVGLLMGRLGPVAACLSLASGSGGPIPELLGLKRWESPP